MRKSLIIILIALIVVCVFIYIDIKDKKDRTEAVSQVSETEGITTLLTLEDEVQNDSIWCGTFQLIWNDLKNDLAKQDIVFTPQLKVVENLNKETFTTQDISDQYYYKKYGIASLELKEEIENAIAEKFNETSSILDDFQWTNTQDKNYFLYAMLKKEFQFSTAFEELENGTFADYENISYFGIETDETGELRNQVEVLYYNSADDFAIKLKTEQEDEVILCKNPTGETFKEIYNNILDKAENYDGNKNLESDEILRIPNITINEKTEFTELENKIFTFSTGEEYYIQNAIQTIELKLDKTGGEIKSEAGITAVLVAVKEEKREFSIDNTFAIFLVEEGKDNPYFAAKIDDITKFQ